MFFIFDLVTKREFFKLVYAIRPDVLTDMFEPNVVLAPLFFGEKFFAGYEAIPNCDMTKRFK